MTLYNTIIVPIKDQNINSKQIVMFRTQFVQIFKHFDMDKIYLRRHYNSKMSLECHNYEEKTAVKKP